MSSVKTINPYRMFDGCVIPIWLVERVELSPGAKLAYGRLMRYAGARGVAFPRLERLSKDLGVGKDQARRYIRELEKLCLITVSSSGFHRANRYRFLEHPWQTGKRGGVSASSRGGTSATPAYKGSLLNQETERVTGQAGAVAKPPGVAARRGPSAKRLDKLLKQVGDSLTM